MNVLIAWTKQTMSACWYLRLRKTKISPIHVHLMALLQIGCVVGIPERKEG